MKITAIITLLTVMLSACASAQMGTAWTDNFNQPRDPQIAEEARSFIIKRQGCDHFRGEPAYDGKRLEFLTQQIKELCTGSDAELRRLRAKFSDQPDTIEALLEFEDCIEFGTVCTEKK